MLKKDNTVKLTDYGFYFVHESYAYMSPEQRRGRLYDEQEEDYSTHRANTDIWLEFHSKNLAKILIFIKITFKKVSWMCIVRINTFKICISRKTIWK